MSSHQTAAATTVHFETVRTCDYDMWRKFDLDIHVYMCIFILGYRLYFCELEMIYEVAM
jgi:hypothetical protein